MKLFIADDNVPFRTRLTSILAGIDGIEIVGVAGDVPGAIDAIKRTKPDTVILDIYMPGGDGLDVLHEIKSARPSPVVIMLTVGPRNSYETMSYLTGADYFFEKTSELWKMGRMLKAIAREQKSMALRHQTIQEN